MQIELTAEQVAVLMSRLPAEARQPDVDFVYAHGHLLVPLEWAEAVYDIVSVPGWDTAPDKARLVAHAAAARWRKEVGGVLVGTVPVATDDRSKLMITGARVAAMADPDWTTVWHGSDGNTYPVDVAAMVAISDAVQAHVNAGFATFAAVKAAIEAGTITTTAEVDAAFGP